MGNYWDQVKDTPLGKFVLKLPDSDDKCIDATEKGIGAAETALKRMETNRVLHDPSRWEVLCRDMAYWEAKLAWNKESPRAPSVSERIAWAAGWHHRSAAVGDRRQDNEKQT